MCHVLILFHDLNNKLCLLLFSFWVENLVVLVVFMHVTQAHNEVKCNMYGTSF